MWSHDLQSRRVLGYSMPAIFLQADIVTAALSFDSSPTCSYLLSTDTFSMVYLL